MSERITARLRHARPNDEPSSERTDRAFEAILRAEREKDEASAGPGRAPRRAWRSRQAAWVAFAVALVLAAPAVAYVSGVIDFHSQETAPPIVRKQFTELFVSGAPPTMDPRALPLSTRKVRDYVLPDGRHTLWVAPTAGGGFCKVFTDFAGGCTATRTTPVPRVISATEINPWLLDVIAAFHSPGPPGPSIIAGHALVPYPSTLELEYEDGDTEQIPLTFVSAPIDAAFFMFTVPDKRRRAGHSPARLTARGPDGEILAETVEQVNPPDGPR